MKLSKKWIEQFTPVSLSNEELVRRIGAQLGAVEGTEDWSSYYDDTIVIAEIVEAGDHPDADKLGVFTIKINPKGDTRQLVAGDKSLQVGDRVGYIAPGSRVPLSVQQGEPFVITERELRGKTSQGMLGSGKELLLNDDHSGVAKLDTDAALGTSLKQAYQLDDFIIEIENKMFTHRPDLFGILGLAREVAGIQGDTFTSPDWWQEVPKALEITSQSVLPLTVKNLIPEECRRFVAVAVDNLKVGPSPIQVQSWLFRVGLRPINNVVDATNYIMYLTAQPSHAFDYDKVARLSKNDAALVVRKANKGEQLTLLDGRRLTLSTDTMIVASDQQVLSVAGSIGGAESEVDESTTRAIIEVANWDLYAIRRTSFEHGIFTDAVTRNNKGQSPKQCLVVAHEVVKQLTTHASGQVASEVIDDYPGSNSKAPTISLTSGFVNTRLGSTFSIAEISSILGRTEIKAVSSTGDQATFSVPMWRTDLHVPEDLVEEVGRLVGFDNLPIELPERQIYPNFRSAEFATKQHIRQVMAAAGAHEILTYNFVSEALLKKAGQTNYSDEAYRIRNSISPQLEYMRVGLLPSILEKVNPNVRQGFTQFGLFEVNKVHNKKELDAEKLPIERNALAFVFTSSEISSDTGAAFYRAKAYLFRLLSDRVAARVRFSADVPEAKNPWQSATAQLFEPKRRAAIMLDDIIIGFIGEFAQSIKLNFKLPEYTAGFEIDVDALPLPQATYTAIARFPVSKQEITLEVPDELTYDEALELIQANLTIDGADAAVRPLYIYRAEDGSRRRLSFALSFQSKERTLTTDETNQAIEQLVTALKQHNVSQV